MCQVADKCARWQINVPGGRCARSPYFSSYGVACISQREKMSPTFIGNNLGSEQLRRPWRWFIFTLLGSVILCLCVSLFVSTEAQAKTGHSGEPARTSEPVNDKASGGKNDKASGGKNDKASGGKNDKPAPKDATPKDATPKDATPNDATPNDATPNDATP